MAQGSTARHYPVADGLDRTIKRSGRHRLDVAVVQSAAGFSTLVDEWRDLQAAYGTYVFTDPTLVDVWWRLRGEPRGETLHIVTARQEGRLVALAPLAVSRRAGLRYLRRAGTDVFDYCDALISDEVSAAALWRAVRRSGGHDLALLKTIRSGSSTYRVLEQSGTPFRSAPTFQATLGETSAAWRQWNTGSKSRRRAHELEKRGVRYEVVRAGPVPERVFAALVAQKAAWAAQQTKPGLFDDAEAAALILRGIAEAFARMGVLHLSWLECGETIIAVHLGCVYRSRFYYYMPSYDLAWAKLSPGKQLLAANLGWSAAHGLSEFDLLRGGDAYKTDVADQQRDTGDFLIAGSFGGHLAKPMIRRLLLSRSSAAE
jgi:CelD/BcsL family acetyltransferase involved in cellulose biosynthesis